MSKHSFSVLTSDIRRNPSILEGVVTAAGNRPPYAFNVTITERGAVTTVTAVAA